MLRGVRAAHKGPGWERAVMKERCDFCRQEVPVEHICRFVPEDEHFEEMCLVVCRSCLERTGVAYWADGRFRRAEDPAHEVAPFPASHSKSGAGE